MTSERFIAMNRVVIAFAGWFWISLILLRSIQGRSASIVLWIGAAVSLLYFFAQLLPTRAQRPCGALANLFCLVVLTKALMSQWSSRGRWQSALVELAVVGAFGIPFVLLIRSVRMPAPSWRAAFRAA
jgi:hypothetical protein